MWGILVIGCLLCLAQVHATSIFPTFEVSDVFNHKQYLLYRTEEKNYDRAQAICNDAGGYLAELQSDQEFYFVAHFLEAFRGNGEFEALVGINDRDQEGVYVNSFSGGPAEYLHWDTEHGEPDGEGIKNQDCVALISGRFWRMYDVLCDHTYYTVFPLCEVPEQVTPPPTTTEAPTTTPEPTTTTTTTTTTTEPTTTEAPTTTTTAPQFFTITTKTMGTRHADTRARVYIILYGGEDGQQRSERFELGEPGHVFDTYATDSFEIPLEKLITPITALEIGHDDSGRAPAWKLDYVEVSNPESGVTQRFPFKRWLKEKAQVLHEDGTYEDAE